MVVLVPIRLGCGQNNRGHWHRASIHKKREQAAVRMRLNLLLRKPTLPLVITMTRISPGRTLLDDDNLVGACKYVRDAIAAWIGFDDGDPGYTWICTQERGGWGLRIQWEPRQ